MKARKPTVRQITALKYINEGMSKKQAMLKAGYSENSASMPSVALFGKKGVQTFLQRIQKKIKINGLAEDFIAAKFKEWLTAQKTQTSMTGPDSQVPDYDTQLKAYEKWEKVMGVHTETPPGLKRKLTIEEFINGGK